MQVRVMHRPLVHVRPRPVSNMPEGAQEVGVYTPNL